MLRHRGANSMSRFAKEKGIGWGKLIVRDFLSRRDSKVTDMEDPEEHE